MKNLDKQTVFFIALVFFGWGTSVFFDKLAANRMGIKGSLIYIISSLPTILILLFFLFWGYKIGNFDRLGIIWVTIAAFFNIIALISYYFVFLKAEASWAVAVTALYPLFTVILAYFFLHEKITFNRLIGIVMAMLALVFLSI